MSHPSASTEPVSADSEPPLAHVSGRSGKGNPDTGARTMALVVSVLVGVCIGIRIGNAGRKRLDRWSRRYLCLFGRATLRRCRGAVIPG
jgi:hypothetical protein